MKIAHQLLGFRNVGGVGFFFGFVATKIYDFLVMSYRSLPRFLLEPSFVGNALQPVFVRSSRVCPVLAIGGQAQIYDPVVVSNPIDVINLVWRELSVNEKPRKPVSGIGLAIHLNKAVSLTPLYVPSLATGCAVFKANPPREMASFWVVVKRIKKFVFFHMEGLPERKSDVKD